MRGSEGMAEAAALRVIIKAIKTSKGIRSWANISRDASTPLPIQSRLVLSRARQRLRENSHPATDEARSGRGRYGQDRYGQGKPDEVGLAEAGTSKAGWAS